MHPPLTLCSFWSHPVPKCARQGSLATILTKVFWHTPALGRVHLTAIWQCRWVHKSKACGVLCAHQRTPHYHFITRTPLKGAANVLYASYSGVHTLCSGVHIFLTMQGTHMNVYDTFIPIHCFKELEICICVFIQPCCSCWRSIFILYHHF